MQLHHEAVRFVFILIKLFESCANKLLVNRLVEGINHQISKIIDYIITVRYFRLPDLTSKDKRNTL